MHSKEYSVRGHEFTIDRAFLAEPTHELVYLTPPHAPSLITTLSPNGEVNVGAFEQTMVASNHPPMLVIAITPDTDTYRNIMDTSECVIGFTTPTYAQQVYDAGVSLPRGVSELPFLKDFTTAPSQAVAPPRIEQCWLAAEGKLHWVQESGDHHALGIEIVHVTLDKRLWKEDKVERRTGLPALYYATTGHFFTPGEWTVLQHSKEVSQVSHPDNSKKE